MKTYLHSVMDLANTPNPCGFVQGTWTWARKKEKAYQ